MVDPILIDSKKEQIVEIISQHIPLRRSGVNWRGRCPWHHPDTHPSFCVSERKRLWRCWTCSIGGDVFNFLMRFLKVSFLESLIISGLPVHRVDQVNVRQMLQKIDRIRRWKESKLEELRSNEDHLQFLSRHLNFLINSTPPDQRETWMYSTEHWLDAEFEAMREKKDEIIKTAHQSIKEVQQWNHQQQPMLVN